MATDQLVTPEPKSTARRMPRLMQLARWLVFGLILFSIGALLYSIVLFPAIVQDGAIAGLAPNTNWTAEMTQSALDQLGWSPKALAWFNAILGWIAAFVYCAVGLIVFRRKSNSWFGLYIAFTFAVLNTSAGVPQIVREQVGPLLTGWYYIVAALSWQFILILFYLFPDGRFVPAWTRWLVLSWLIGSLLSEVFGPINIYLGILFFGLAISALASQIYRYLRVSTALQRQQTKWIAFMGGVFILLGFPQIISFLVPPSAAQNLGGAYLTSTIISILGNIWILCLPIAIGIAILRYRLWDIDIIIRRTLVYLPLTAILAGVFAASIRLLQAFFISLSGQESGIATGLTTLFVVAIFEPIKRWLQKIVDARFKEIPDLTLRWKAYDEQIHAFVQMSNAKACARRLLEEAAAMFEANDGAVYLQKAGEMHLVHSLRTSNSPPEVSIPLVHHGYEVGSLTLGTRRNGQVYGQHERELLIRTANAVAAAIRQAGTKDIKV